MVEVQDRAQVRAAPRCAKTLELEDRIAIRSHVELVHTLAAPLAGQGKLVVSSFGQDPATGRDIPPRIEHFQIGEVYAMVAAIVRLAQDPHRNVYVSLAVMRPGLEAGKKGTEDDVVGVLGLVADFDDDDAASYARRLPVTAPYVLKTSLGRFQAFLPFDQPATVQDAKPVAVRLKEVARCDHGTVDMSHVWRVSGTRNWPNKRKVDGGRSNEPQRVEALGPWGKARISLDDVRKALPEKVRTTEGRPKPLDRTIQDPGDLPPRLVDMMAENLPKGQRSERVFAVACALIERGWSDDRVIAEIQQYPDGVGEKHMGNEKALRAEVERARAKAKGDRRDYPGGRQEAFRHGKSNGTARPVQDQAPQRQDGAGQPPESDAVRKKADRQPARRSVASDLGDYDPTEDGIALAFAERFRDRLLYCHSTGAWFAWTGSSWRKERTKLAFHWARDLCRELNAEANVALSKARTAGAVETFAQADRAFAVTNEIWDREAFLLNTPGGTVELKTGALRDARPKDFMTKETAVAPADPLHGDGCPQWLAFLDQATQGDKELIRFLQQISGYCLTGDVREHALFFIYGPGGNGKGVFLNTIMKILGDYATTAAMDTFTASKGDRHPTDLAKLMGARLVSASETEEGRAWAESRIKEMTGGDRISARFMRQDFFEFDPTFKLLIVGNHKPILRNVDDAAKRRFNIIPFIHQPEKRDQQLEAKLKEEWPAILRWMIDGCLDWQRHGLVRPASVGKATDEYFSSQDLFGQWLEECCELHPGKDNRLETAADLFASWKDFAESHGEDVGNSKGLGDKLSQRGVGSNRRRHPMNGKTCVMRTGISIVRSPARGGDA